MSKRFVITLVVLWAALAASVAVLASGWLDRPPRAVPPGQQDTITTAIGMIMGRWDEAICRQVIDEYNRRHPDVHVEALLMPYAVYLGKVRLMVAAGQPPDVVENASVLSDTIRQSSNIPDLLVPVPEAMIPESERRRYDPGLMTVIRNRGRIVHFPKSYCLTGQTLMGNLDWFEKAGIDIRRVLEEGWDYAEFRAALKRLQQVLRQEKGPSASALGFNLVQLDRLYHNDLLPQVIGVEATRRRFLAYDEPRRRFVLDPALTPEQLAQPLQLMRDLLSTDGTWDRRTLGMDFNQITNDFVETRNVAIQGGNMPSSPIDAQIDYMRDYAKGLHKTPLRLTIVPAPVPRKGMPLVFNAYSGGWGVLRQEPSKGELHTRHALEFARYMASPEVLARFYKASGLRGYPFPDPEAVYRLVPGVDDPIRKDSWLAYLSDDLYVRWRQNAPVAFPINDEHDQERMELNMLVAYEFNGYLASQGHQILEAVLYGRLEPHDAACKLLAGIKATIDQYYAGKKGRSGIADRPKKTDKNDNPS